MGRAGIEVTSQAELVEMGVQCLPFFKVGVN